jgi:hypothetical protein
MKFLLAILGGFCATLVVFGSGVIFGVMLLTGPEPSRSANVDSSDLWTNEPVRIDSAGSGKQRHPMPAGTLLYSAHGFVLHGPVYLMFISAFAMLGAVVN